MKLEFFKNGFEIHYTSKNNKKWKEFIPFQAITSIGDVEVKVNYTNYDILLRQYTGEFVEKYCLFSIFTDKREIKIYLYRDKKSFPRISDEVKNWSVWKRFLFSGTNKEGLSEEANDWLYDYEKDMDEPIKHLTEVRDELIKHFNEWNCLIERK